MSHHSRNAVVNFRPDDWNAIATDTNRVRTVFRVESDWGHA